MANFWKRKYNKSNKSAYDISKEINVPEEKVKEIIKGERQVPTKDIDKVNEAFSENKFEITSIERALMEQFFKENKIKELRKKFNYSTNQEMANAMNIGVATLYKLNNKEIKHISDKLLVKIYDFFQNDWNTNVRTKKEKTSRAKKVLGLYISYKDLPKEVKDWYKNTDIKALRKSRNLTGKQLIKLLGYNDTYYGILCKAESKNNFKKYTSNYTIIQQLYNFYNGKELLDVYNKQMQTTENNCKQSTETREEKYKYNAELSVPTDDKYESLLKEYQNAINELNRYKYLIDKLMEKEEI